MPTIADIVAGIEAGTVTLRGKPVRLRAVSAAESAKVRACYPRPIAPPGPNPLKGSASAEVILCEHDPRYQRELGEWRARVACVEAAVALELSVGGQLFSASMTTEEALAWAGSALAQLSGALSETEIARVNRAVDALGGEAAVEAAQGN